MTSCVEFSPTKGVLFIAARTGSRTVGVQNKVLRTYVRVSYGRLKGLGLTGTLGVGSWVWVEFVHSVEAIVVCNMWGRECYVFKVT